MKLEYIDYDSCYCNVMFWLSVMLCSCRVRIYDEYRKIDKFPNLYILKFAGQGTGKGRTSKTVEALLEKWSDSMEFREGEFRKAEQSAIEGSAALQGIKTGAKKFDLIEKMMPPVFMPIITSSATSEGIMAQRNAMEKAGFGCMYWIENEIYDMMEKCYPGTRQWDIMTIMKEVFDNGLIDPKLIAGNKKLHKTKSIPHCAFIQGAIDDKQGFDPFLRFFKLGYARRLLVCTEKAYQTKERRRKDTTQKKLLEANIEEPTIKEFLGELYKRMRGGVTYTMSNEVKDAYDDYKEDCRIKAMGESRKAGGILKDHAANKFWNVINMAAIYESVNGMTDVISLGSFNQAVSAIDYFEKNLTEFCGMGVTTSGRELYESMLSDGPQPTSYFISLPIFPKNRNKGYKMFHEMLEDVRIIAAENNQIIIEEEKHKKHVMWSILNIPVHSEEPVTAIRLSVGGSAELTETNFEAVDAAFDKLHEITGGNVCYSAGIFRNNKRGVKNWIGRNDLLILDIDNDKGDEITIEQARARFSGYKHMICATKSHQIEKHGKVTDRFRIILPITYCELDNDKFKAIVKNMVRTFGLESVCDTPASSDPSRMYIPFKGEYHYNLDGLTMNPLAYYYETEAGDVIRKFPPHQTLDGKGITELIQEAKHKGRTIPCHAFCHDDKTPSAFFCINRDGNFQYTCTACGQSYFYKLK